MANTKTLDEGLVTFRASGRQILQQPAPPGHHGQQPLAGAIVFAMGFEMICQLGYAPAQDRHLDFRRTAVILVNTILRYKLLFNVFRQCHPYE